jgi:hypothetical protein
MSYNNDAYFFASQVVVKDTSSASSTGGGLVVEHLTNATNMYVTGNMAINNINVTPNIDDIIDEVEFNILANITQWTNVTGLAFTNAKTTSFKAKVNVVLNSSPELIAIYDIYCKIATSVCHVIFRLSAVENNAPQLIPFLMNHFNCDKSILFT